MYQGQEIEPGTGPTMLAQGLVLLILLPVFGSLFGGELENDHTPFARRLAFERNGVIIIGDELTAISFQKAEKAFLVGAVGLCVGDGQIDNHKNRCIRHVPSLFAAPESVTYNRDLRF